MTRAILIGMTIAIFSGLGFYILTTGVDLIASTPVYVPVIHNGTLTGYTITPQSGAPFNPIAIMLLVVGGVIVAALGIEMSADIEADQNNTPNPPVHA